MAIGRNRLRQLLLLILIIAVVYIFVLYQIEYDRKDTYRKHFDYLSEFVDSNYDYLNQIVKSVQNKTISEQDAEEELTLYGVDTKAELQMNGNVEFMCIGEGFASNSRYYGFFYSSDNDIREFSWYNDDYKAFSELEQGLYTDDGTDNYIYIEPLNQHWYYYCVGF